MKVFRTTRRLRIPIVFTAVRGAAAATGSGLVGRGWWLITHH